MLIIKIFHNQENPSLWSVSCRSDLKSKLLDIFIKNEDFLKNGDFKQVFFFGTKECHRDDINLEIFTDTNKSIDSQTYQKLIDSIEADIISFLKKQSEIVFLKLSIIWKTNNQTYSKYFVS